MGEILPIIIQLVTGALGGNAAGALLKKFSLGTLWNSVAGIVGGAAGGQILGLLGVAAGGGGTDLMSILMSIVGGGVGGGLLMTIVGLIKKALAK